MPFRPRYDRLKLGFHGQDGGAELDGGQLGRLMWFTGPPPSTVPHPTASMGVTNGAALAAASTHDTQTHHLPHTLYEEPFHPCNICTGVPPTLKRPAPTRVVLWDPQTTNTSTRGCSMCPVGASPSSSQQVPDTALAVLDRDQGATAYLVGLKDRHGVGFDAANQSGR